MAKANFGVMKTILLTGGAGYIGSHTAVELLLAGYNVVIFDNFSNSDRRALRQVERLTNKTCSLIEGDVRDGDALAKIFADHMIDAVVHFAGLKAVGDSVARPNLYYDVNITGSLALLAAMASAQIGGLVFSSSATVYGAPDKSPISESAPYRPDSPYGRSKMMVELAMADAANALDQCAYLSLRYFNPVGAHESGEIGEDPADIPNNLFPYLAQVAVGRRSHLIIHGDDYPTPDGTGVRDYLHVVDLAKGHVAALDYVLSMPAMGYEAVNLGTGQGHSVKEVLAAFGQAVGHDLPFKIGSRRAGDVPAYWGDPTKAWDMLGWTATKTLKDMCADTWRWQSRYPKGYAEM